MSEPERAPPATDDRPLLGGLLLANLLIAALLTLLGVLSLSASRQAFLQQARTATENLAQALQAGLEAELTQVDMVLRTIEQAPRDAAARAALLPQQIALVPQVESLRVTDAQGVVREGQGLLGALPVDLSDREIFRRLCDEPGSDTLVSEPLIAHVSRHRVIGMARRLQDADGGFAGIVYANVPVSHFQQRFKALGLGPRDAVTLRSASRRLIVRQTGEAADGDASPGENSAQVSAALEQALRIDPAQGSFIASTAHDGVERVSAYRRLPHSGLLVLVGLATEQYLAPWRSQRSQVLTLIALLIMLVSGASALLWRNWRRESAAARRHRTLLRTASDGIHVLDREGRVVEASESFARMLGCRHEALLGRPVASWDAQLSAAEIEAWLRDFPAGESRRFETRHRRADGSLIDVEVHCAAAHIDGRDLIYCSARDISEGKRLARQLAASAAEVQDLYDNAPCGYHSLDAQGRFLHVNATELAWLGCTREDLIGRGRITDFLDEQGRKQFRLHFPRLLAGERITGLELDLQPVGAPPRRVSISASGLFDAQGRFLRSRSVMYDVSALQQAREQLQEALRTQQAMLDNELIGIIRSRQGLAQWVNPAMTRIFGLQPDELLGQSVRRLYPDDASYRAFLEEAQPVLAAGGRYRAQLRTRHRDGRTIWVDVNGVRLSAERDESLWLLADITPIKEAQQQAEHLAQHDALTGLPNRLLLADRLSQALAGAERQGQRLGLCFLDLDGFKPINDALGHAAGDALLCQVAWRLQAGLRASDTVARLGGDEFVLLLSPLADAEELQHALVRVQAALAAPIDCGGRQVHIGASIGVALYPDDGHTAEQLLSRADQAMYAAKARGRGSISLYASLRPPEPEPAGLDS